MRLYKLTRTYASLAEFDMSTKSTLQSVSCRVPSYVFWPTTTKFNHTRIMQSTHSWNRWGWMAQATAGFLLFAFNITIASVTLVKLMPLVADAPAQSRRGVLSFLAPQWHGRSLAFYAVVLPYIVAAYDLWVSGSCVWIFCRMGDGEESRADRVTKFAGEWSYLAIFLRFSRRVTWFVAHTACAVLIFVTWELYSALDISDEEQRQAWRLAFGASFGLEIANSVYLCSTALFAMIAMHTGNPVWDVLRLVAGYDVDG